VFLQGEYREICAFMLVLIQACAVEIADAIDREAERGLTGIVRNLELALKRPQDHADPRSRIDNCRRVGQTVELAGGIVDRVEA
jgi:hypothetical protein